MKKAFTMVELTIAIALLGTIIVAVFSLFMTADKNYRVESQRTYLQKEINITADALANEMKLAHSVIENAHGKTLSSTTLIMQVPAIDNNGNFIYTEGVLEFDIFIYEYKQAEKLLEKTVIPNQSSARAGKSFIVLRDVASVNFAYNPDIYNPLSIKANFEVTRVVGKNNIHLSAERTAFLRNR